MSSLDKGGYHDTLPSKSKILLQSLYGESCESVDDVITGHLAAASMEAVEFPENSDWVNSPPLCIYGNLKGRYILLDFFTYCCINCMHILPALHQLELDVPQGLVVVGVHSGKFSNEKDNNNILNAVSRYKITHPVINDQNYDMWNSYSIICWPTLVLINPAGKVVLISIGESDVDKVCKFVKDVVRLSPPTELQPIPLTTDTDIDGGRGSSKKVLSYPGKVYYHEDSNTLFIADTSNNRVLQTNIAGEILQKFPSPESPALDGPQGLLVYEKWVYVCDTNNHRVVRMEMESGVLEVVCGTGVQGHDLEGGKSGIEQEISSPWDIEIISLENLPGCLGEILMIAMAGTHQIWGYALTDLTLAHRGQNTVHERGKTWRLAGSGDEANKNNSYPHKASFAQPSGLSWDGGKFVFVADSESSTVRSLELPSFAVKNLVGGGLDPSDLFAYGDADGKGTAAKLQHPIGVAVISDHSVLIADSYNHKLKLAQMKSRIVSTCCQVSGLSEPSGLTYDQHSNRVFIADTNNHSVKVVKVGESGDCAESKDLQIVDRARFAVNTGVSWVLREDTTTSLTLSLTFSKKLNSSAPSKIEITHYTTLSLELKEEVPVTGCDVVIPLPGGTTGAADLLITLFTCSDDGACFMDKYLHRINFVEDSVRKVLLDSSEPIVINLN